MGLPFTVPGAALRPRSSSAVLVEQALRRLHSCPRRGQEPLRVLDLGTGAGALLLATVAHAPTSTSTPPSPTQPWDVVGVGLDLDPVALAAAQGNADALGVSPRCAWVTGDFARLHAPATRAALAAALTAVCGPPGPGPGLGTDHAGMFDVIVCNPPYLSARAAHGRVTAEGALALVHTEDDDGLGAYRAICRAVAAPVPAPSSPSAGGDAWLRMPLLRGDGCGAIVFQSPGGARGGESVVAAVEGLVGLGWRVAEVVADGRGVRRCVVVVRASGVV